MHQRIIAAATAVLAACSPLASPTAHENVAAWSRANIADIDILDRSTGERLAIYWHDGQRWIAGTPGHRYAVSLRNATPGRVLGVVSVDGVNAVSGESADWGQRGYVLAPWQAFDILGWRKSHSDVADFVFTAVERSYAARTGRPENAGVIGVALFREAAPTLAPPVGVSKAAPPAARAGDDGSADAAGASAAPLQGLAPSAEMERASPRAPMREQRLGTGHGPAETSVVSTTSFERAHERPDEILSIRYDRRERLVAMGIIAAITGPLPFPGSPDAGFVPDPPPGIR